MTDPGTPSDSPQRADDAARQWLRALLDRWDTDPDLVQSMSRDEIRDALGPGAKDDVQSLRTWVDNRMQAQADAATQAHGSTSSRRAADREPSPAERRSSLRLVSTPMLLRWAASFVGVLLLAYGVLWGVGRGTQPDLYALASLDGHTAQVDALVSLPTPHLTKDGASSDAAVYQAEVRAGAALLRDARTAPLGLFPHYNTSRAALGVATLERAYASRTAPMGKEAPSTGDDPFADFASGKYDASPGAVAFLIAKGYLMLEDADSARLWLQRCLDHADTTWHPDASRLLEALPTGYPPP